MKKKVKKLVLRLETIQQLGIVQGAASKFNCDTDAVRCPPLSVGNFTCDTCWTCAFTCGNLCTFTCPV